jgi:hypothetical protein
MRPAVDVLDLSPTASYAMRCSYSLEAVAAGAYAFSLAAGPSGRLFVNIQAVGAPLSGAVVELNPRVCGQVKQEITVAN